MSSQALGGVPACEHCGAILLDGGVCHWHGVFPPPCNARANKSDCATHNAPALEPGPCDCGAERDPFGGDQDILTVLQKVNHERASQYGTPEDNFARIARHWQVYLLNAKGLDVEITPTDVALLMDLMKTARLENMPNHRDSWVDKAGYARCGAAIEANLARYGKRKVGP